MPRLTQRVPSAPLLLSRLHQSMWCRASLPCKDYALRNSSLAVRAPAVDTGSTSRPFSPVSSELRGLYVHIVFMLVRKHRYCSNTLHQILQNKLVSDSALVYGVTLIVPKKRQVTVMLSIGTLLKQLQSGKCMYLGKYSKMHVRKRPDGHH